MCGRDGTDNKLKQIMETRLEGRMTRGSSRKPYRDNIEQIERKNGTGVTRLLKITGERREWRRWIKEF